jgi:hypothetical protein
MRTGFGGQSWLSESTHLRRERYFHLGSGKKSLQEPSCRRVDGHRAGRKISGPRGRRRHRINIVRALSPRRFQNHEILDERGLVVASLSFVDGHMLIFALRSLALPGMWPRHRSTEFNK